MDKDKIIRWSILLVVLFFCFTDLSLKPPHFDEGINGLFVNQIWENGFFTYDPNNYHGPLLFYLFQISEKIFGFGVRSFRIVSALFVFLTVAFILLSRITLGRHASLFAALALGLSPGMIFFGRSAIHESAFVFFQIVWMVGFLKAREEMNEDGLLWFFTGFMGCILLKETFVILGASFLLAWVWLQFSPRVVGWLNMKVDYPGRLEFTSGQKVFLLKTSFVVIVVWLAFHTAFFHHWSGVHDFFIALAPWLKTGVGGSGHNKPFYYWLQLLGRYEWAGVFGVIAACAGVFNRSWKMRFISLLALTNGFIYSYIHYKTPWAVLAVAPDPNHPAEFWGAKVAMGYLGHSWTHGIDYTGRQSQMEKIFRGDKGWFEMAREIGITHICWGENEKRKYGTISPSRRAKLKNVSRSREIQVYDLRSFQDVR